MKLSDFDILFKVNPHECTGYSDKIDRFLMDTFPEKGSTIGPEIDEFERLYDQYLLGEIQDYKSEWAKFINKDLNKIPDEVFKIAPNLISLSHLEFVDNLRLKTKKVYYESTFKTITESYQKLVKNFCNVEMELIDTYYSNIILKNKKIKVINTPFVEAFFYTVQLYYNPKEWKKRQEKVSQIPHLESLITQFIARSIGSINLLPKEEQASVKFLCSLMLLEEEKIKSGFYSNVA